MPQQSSLIGTIGAIIGFLLPSFLLLWTGGESVSMILSGAYLFLWGSYSIDLGYTSISDSGFHFFNPNWYLDPSIANINQGSHVIDGYLDLLAVSIYPGEISSSALDISGILFGISAIIIIIGVVIGLINKKDPKTSGILFICGGVIALIALLFIWNNATGLPGWIGSGVENNFLPVPFGSLLVLGSGIWNFLKG